jgi:hypothetical protein
MAHITFKPTQKHQNYLTKTPIYDIEKALLLALARHFETEELKTLWDQLKRFNRHDVLEQAVFKTPDGDLIVPTNIANKNFRAMERATATKWAHDLTILFDSPATQGIPLHKTNGRVSIAIPGVRLGLEIGGILDFFNEQGITVDITAFDISIAAAEEQLLNLETRKSLLGSTVTFHSHMNAAIYLKGKLFDIVVMRNPGSPTDTEYLEWKQIIKSVIQTRPGIIILSTYEYEINNLSIIQEAGGTEPIKESHLFDSWLKQFGYFPKRVVQNSWLQYPYSPYMIVPDESLSFTWPSDRYMALYTNR